MNKTHLAKALGLPKQRITEYEKRGMPVDDVGRAEHWLRANITPRAPRKGVTQARLPPPDVTPQAENETWEAVLIRCRRTERIAGEALQNAFDAGDVALLDRLQTSHSKAVTARADAERLASAVRVSTGEMMHRTNVRKIINEIMIPLREEVRALPITERARCNPDHPHIAGEALTAWVNRLCLRISTLETKL